MKKCHSCGETKPIFEFWKQTSNKSDGLQSDCKICCKKQMRIWRAQNSARQKLIQRKGKLKDTYGMTQEDWDRLFKEQDGRCAICRRIGGGISRDFPLDVDHCHTSGKVRGLLCGPCNRGIGQLSDSPERLRAAAAYIENAQKEVVKTALNLHNLSAE